ncbi:gamma-glutamyl-gamma-aminobutyrate hydrolase family protein [Wenzhouxiangella sp. AB-CW3]|uniref:type 1 glutamine amidotransferase n=1 Tax=Wenzhouxiangella sp. AB-CW3 TaxID=2771012 RepID=UPI00168A9AE2|nr:gamma-glutamyl-gamma-aminobutyrate hydrolase family protein [Wenzhouxiangella sp. AB-CW3]QOC23558.1 gamma-glutamyl-gamma-aminobutyrate hydrolase family protein [Wenzhouxiangella sp. AB-CW3]
MARVLVLKHVVAEPLGLLDPMLRERGHRIRYVNFARDPDARPRLDRYQALIVLGGPMQVDDAQTHPHLLTECHLIEQAMAADMPVLGICLGAQLMAHVLGAPVGPCEEPEIGWYDLKPTNVTSHDPVLCPLEDRRPVYQWHHWGFDCPADSVSLAVSDQSGCQAFRHGERAWGFQFHLELDERLIRRWLTLPFYRKDLAAAGLRKTPEDLREATQQHLPQSLQLADQVFGNWLGLLESPRRRVILGSR